MKYIIKRLVNILLVISQYSPFALIWMIKAFVIDWPLRKWSFYKLPEKAGEMGLHYIESDYRKEFGIIKGRIQGYFIEIKPAESMNSSIKVAANFKDSKFELSLHRPSMMPGKKQSGFKTGNRIFNSIFKTKMAHINSIQKLAANNELYARLSEFYTEWIFKVENLRIDNGEIFCSFKYGFNFFSYIPVYRIERIIKQLVNIAEKYDQLFREK
ncbi:MAG: hypothetical protein JW864_00590 [Spirochaetes bacterium]|nr:hypothetical protein [Spirochaetota bacterium]